MRKWIALLLAFCLLIPCTAFGETAVETETGNETPSLHSVRYYFEHQLLPQLLYADPEVLITFLEREGTFELWNRYTEQYGLEAYYTADVFGEELVTTDDGILMMVVKMPAPEETPLCSRIYLCLDKNTGKAGCYTVEYDNFMGEAWFLCGWTMEGNHMNFGTIPALPDPESPDYAEALRAEREQVLSILKEDTEPETVSNFGN